MHIAARSPDSPFFQKDRDTLEQRSGRWLKDLVSLSNGVGFDLNAWIPAWDGGSSDRQIPARN